MENRARYEQLLAQLYRARSEGELTAQHEYEFTCVLEEIWNLLDESDQAKVEALTEDYKRSLNAPKALGTDLKVPVKSHARPRAA